SERCGTVLSRWITACLTGRRRTSSSLRNRSHAGSLGLLLPPHSPAPPDELGRSETWPGELLAHPAGCDCLLDRLLHGRHIEASSRLHRRKFDEGLRSLRNFLLNESEAPELIDEPVVVGDRTIVLAIEHAGALIRIEAQIDQDRPVDLLGRAEPAAGLVGEAILEVVDAHRGQRGFSEIENLVTLGRALAGDQVELIVAVEMHLEGLVADLLAGQQFVRNVRIAGGSDEVREPVDPGDDAVLHLAGGNLPRPAHDRRHAEAAFETSALAAGERRLSAIRPGEILGAVVGGEDDDGVVVEPVVLQIRPYRADDLLELRDPPF